MTSALRPIVNGLDYQARWFWLEAIRLLYDPPAVTHVTLEARAPRAFDDVVSRASRPDGNSFGQRVDLDGYQAKFKVDHRKALTVASLADPDFVNATTRSILERLRDAHIKTAAAGLGGRFTLVTPWRFGAGDQIERLVTTNGELDLDYLYDGGARSEVGKIRAAWRGHLGLPSDDELRPILERFRIFLRTPDEVNRVLEGLLSVQRLTPAPAGSLRHPYVDTVIGLLRSRRGRVFDPAALKALIGDASLAGSASELSPVAIRSFRRDPTWNLQDLTPALLDLVPVFHGRALKTGFDWDAVRDQLDTFLANAIRPGSAYRIYLDAHASIAYAAGWLANRGAAISPVQRTRPGVVEIWAPGAIVDEHPWQEPREILTGSGGRDLAVAISLTHVVPTDVEAYVARELPSVRRIVALEVAGGAKPGSVRDATHALELADAAAKTLGSRPDPERGGRVHIFAAAPNGFMFFLGRLGHPLGPTTVYEYDFGTRDLGAYAPAINLAPTGI